MCGVEPKQRDTPRVINYPAQVSSSLLIDFTTHRWSLFFVAEESSSSTLVFICTHTHTVLFFSDKNKNLLLLFCFLFYCCTHSRTTVKQKCVVSRSLSQLVDRNGWFRDWVFGFVQSASSSSPPTKNPDPFFFFSLVGGRRDVHTHKLQRIAPALLICVSMGHLNTRPRSAAFRRPARLYFLIALRLFVVAMAVSRTARRVSTTVTMNETCILAYFLFIYFFTPLLLLLTRFLPADCSLIYEQKKKSMAGQRGGSVTQRPAQSVRLLWKDAFL